MSVHLFSVEILTDTPLYIFICSALFSKSPSYPSIHPLLSVSVIFSLFGLLCIQRRCLVCLLISIPSKPAREYESKWGTG